MLANSRHENWALLEHGLLRPDWLLPLQTHLKKPGSDPHLTTCPTKSPNKIGRGRRSVKQVGIRRDALMVSSRLGGHVYSMYIYIYNKKGSPVPQP